MEVVLLMIYPIYEGHATQFRNNHHRKYGILISVHVYCKLPYILPLLAECCCCNRARACVYARACGEHLLLHTKCVLNFPTSFVC